MKNQAILFLAVSILFFVSCKNDGTNQSLAEATSAEVMIKGGADALSTMSGAGAVQLSANLENSFVAWSASAASGSGHRGTVRLQSGDFYVINGNLKRGNFNIDMNSLVVTDLTGQDKADLEGELKGGNFFQVGQFPTGSFSIQGVLLNDGGGTSHLVSGELNLKGISKPISFPANVTVSNGNVVVESPEFPINRTDWGINYKSGVLGTLKDEIINDEVKLKIKLEAPLPAPAK